MARKKVIKKGEAFASINKEIEIERQSVQTDVDKFDIVEHAGGSINNLPVKTKEFGSWLDAHRANNPFIGKHVTAAPEEYTEEVKLNDDEVLDEAAASEFMNQANLGAADFNPNSSYGDEVEDYGEALKGDNEHDKKFIDLSIIENMTKRYLSLPESKIVDEANRAMKAYHGDNSYETSINISNIIEESKVLFIEQKKQEQANAEQLKIASTKAKMNL
jgi:hypothetical protein